MQQNEPKAPPEGDVRAGHGYRNEVSWDGGRGRQPYANQGAEEIPPDTAGEVEAGDAGPIAGNNIEELRQLKEREPGRSPDPSARKD